MKETHQGYSNYETFLVKLHIDNTQEYYNEIQALAKEDKDCSDRELGTKIEAWLHDTVLADIHNANYGSITNQEASNNNVANDLLNAASARVNFTEIAKEVREEL